MKEQAEVFQHLRQEKVIVGGDMRADSAGKIAYLQSITFVLSVYCYTQSIMQRTTITLHFIFE